MERHHARERDRGSASQDRGRLTSNLADPKQARVRIVLFSLKIYFCYEVRPQDMLRSQGVFLLCGLNKTY